MTQWEELQEDRIRALQRKLDVLDRQIESLEKSRRSLRETLELLTAEQLELELDD